MNGLTNAWMGKWMNTCMNEYNLPFAHGWDGGRTGFNGSNRRTDGCALRTCFERTNEQHIHTHTKQISFSFHRCVLALMVYCYILVGARIWVGILVHISGLSVSAPRPFFGLRGELCFLIDCMYAYTQLGDFWLALKTVTDLRTHYCQWETTFIFQASLEQWHQKFCQLDGRC